MLTPTPPTGDAAMKLKEIESLLKEILSKVNTILEHLSDTSPPEEKPEIPDELPIGITDCMKLLTELEGKPITRVAVYNRVNKGTLPHWKKGKMLLFSKREILKLYL